MVLLKSVQAAVLFDLSMSEMEWAGSSGRFDQGPISIPTSNFQLKITKFRIYVDLSWVISGKRDMELLELERLFMKRQHHFHSCISGLGDLPQTGFWIRLHWISMWNLFLTGFLSTFTVPVPAQHFVYPGLWHLFLLYVFFQSLWPSVASKFQLSSSYSSGSV